MKISSAKFPKIYFSFSLMVCLFFSVFTHGQKFDLESTWTDGDIFFYPQKINDSVVTYFGGTLHEGWNIFCMQVNKNGRLSIFHDSSDQCSGERDSYQKIELKSINGKQILIIKDNEGRISQVFRQAYPNEGLQDLIIATKINHELAGKYINSSNGQTVIFYPDKKTVSGLTKLTDYIFEEAYDSPIDVITFKNKQSFMYERTERGLDIYTAKIDKYGEWASVKKLMTLVKTEWLNTDSLKNVPGKYPFASRELLIEGILSNYSSAKLAQMRNEIYARHGLIFKSPALKNYFTKQTWYHPQKENVDNELSDLEKFNIQLLRWYEQKQKEKETTRESDGS